MSNPSGLPDLVFVERDAATIEAASLATIEGRMTEANGGKAVTLALGDPRRVLVSGMADLFVQERQNINITGRQNLLPYAFGNYLLALGKLVLGDNAGKLPASHALSTERFTLSAPRASVTTIQAGRLVSAGGVLFETTQTLEIPIGDLTGDVVVRAVTAGEGGNGFVPGQINAMVEPIPFVASVANLTRSQGGAPEETDDAYRERVRVAPNSFSVAGPEDAYVYWAKTASAAISDVSVLTDEAHPGTVYVRPLLAGGEIPGVEVLELVGAALSNKTRRPLTDYVVPALPSAVTCDVAFTYWIDSKDARRTETIQAAVSTAVTNYLAWQRAALGRDVNPDQLRFMVIAAGAKRLTVTAPAFAALTRAQVAQDGTVAVTYGGLEDA